MARYILPPFLRLAAIAALTIAGSALADGYNTPPLRVLPGQTILKDPYREREPYTLGDQFQLVRRTNYPEAARQDLVKSGFEIRFFRITSLDATPQPWIRDQGDCDIFLTLVIKGLRFQRDMITLGPLKNNYWLNPTADGHFDSGFFLMIIEQNSDIKSAFNDWQVFRLGASAELQRNYFSQGIPIQINPPKGTGKPVLSPDEERKAKEMLDVIAHKISPDLNCYQARPIQLGPNQIAQVALASCADPPPTPGG